MRTLKTTFSRIAAVVMVVFASSTMAEEAQALSKQASDFLLSISIDPTSKDVKLADHDGTIKTTRSGDDEEFSLESIAVAKKVNATKTFINTRVFIRRLKADFNGTAIPKTNYDPLYLTKDERILAGEKFLATLCPGYPGPCS